MIEPKDLPQIKSIVDHAISENQEQNQYAPSDIAFHRHNQIDSAPISYLDLINKQIPYTFTIQGTNASATSSYSVFFIAPIATRVIGVQETHAVAGTNGSPVTLAVEKLTGTKAPGTGTNVISTTFNLKGTANTVITASLAALLATINLNAGDRLAFVLTGTPTSVQNVAVSVTLGF